MAAANTEAWVNVDNLDLDDKLRWVKEILESGRDKFREADLKAELPEFVEKLADEKIISGFNKKKLDKLKDETDIVEELHRVLQTKGWDNFKSARALLYKVIPSLAGIWEENVVEDLPVLSIKYNSSSVENDGAAASGASVLDEVDGAVPSARDTSASEPITKREFSTLPAYNMSNRKNKGICMIINNEDYAKARSTSKDFKDRRGSSKDAELIKEVFSKLGFFVEYQKNLTKAKLDKLVDMMVNFGGLRNYNCFVAVFLSHGENEALSCVDGQEKKIDDIINAFKGDNCPGLNGVPKWFIIQACRGKDFNYEVLIDHDAPGDDTSDCERQSDKPISIPACADFYISYATAPGYYSFRNINEGSWFINDLCKIIREYAHTEDVNTMMTRVNRNVALGRVVQSDLGFRRQMPCHVNMLTSALYLHNIRSSQI